MSTLHRYADYLPAPIADQFPSPVKNRERIRPLTAGQFFQDFYLEEENVINKGALLKDAVGVTSLHLLTAQPLIVAFYSVNWNGYGDALIAELIEKHAAIEAAGARLLVLSSEGKKHFTEFNREPLPFDVARDAQHRIARKAGIYKESDPIWGRVAGVNADVPVPAVYLITPSLEITYSFADVYLEQKFSVDELLSVVDKQLAISA
ncbi:redoxin domain-containing protein [Chitinophaga varians]|uniref:redoxin domain-containing protein n=1 Tax=Chitinophaga varians TaxID=2202339 RepID=UPI00165F883F|nr:redoxin domain-containing protein [Chitinophaga varians]MBC9911390.1 redoxin domain-containing protein [Chitinophaga varians]